MPFVLYDIEKLGLSKGFHGSHWGTLMPFLKACKKQFGEPPRFESATDVFARLDKTNAPLHLPNAVAVDALDMAIMPPNTKWDKPLLERWENQSGSAANERILRIWLSMVQLRAKPR